MRCHPARWLWGLIPVAMLSWLAVHVEVSSIQDDLERRSRLALADAGHDWASVAFRRPRRAPHRPAVERASTPGSRCAHPQYLGRACRQHAHEHCRHSRCRAAHASADRGPAARRRRCWMLSPWPWPVSARPRTLLTARTLCSSSRLVRRRASGRTRSRSRRLPCSRRPRLFRRNHRHSGGHQPGQAPTAPPSEHLAPAAAAPAPTGLPPAEPAAPGLAAANGPPKSPTVAPAEGGVASAPAAQGKGQGKVKTATAAATLKPPVPQRKPPPPGVLPPASARAPKEAAPRFETAALPPGNIASGSTCAGDVEAAAHSLECALRPRRRAAGCGRKNADRQAYRHAQRLPGCRPAHRRTRPTRAAAPDTIRCYPRHRARGVAGYMIHKGIDAGRLVAVGYGDTQPVAAQRQRGETGPATAASS